MSQHVSRGKSAPTKHRRMTQQRIDWYDEYWAQTWYRNTFLVRRATQIARGVDADRDWNSVYDAGCNFTCIAMIIGVNPAYLASTLSTQRFFYADAALQARRVTGKLGGMVWDQNAPDTRRRTFTVEHFWHPRLRRRVTITLSFVESRVTRCYETAVAIINAIRARGDHIVCGTDEHSHLVAGSIGNKYFLWDPSDIELTVEQTLAGEMTLKRLFQDNRARDIEFWRYRCDIQ